MPLSGTSPTRPKASTKVAAVGGDPEVAGEGERHARAPAATPLTAPMIGLSSRRIARISGL